MVYALKMKESSQEKLCRLTPHLQHEELDAAHERLRRYVSLAVEVAEAENAQQQANLTDDSTGVNVNAGQVDPSTFTKTG